ncbi:MAG: MBL fold metallo-hydrolase [Dehalococcoidia bacterium]
MTTRIRFLGVAGYEVVGPNHRFLIDPYLTGNPVAPVGPDDLETPDVILVSHAAWDHLGDTQAIAERTGAPIVCGQDTKALLVDRGMSEDQIRPTVTGIVVEVGGVVVRPVHARHWSMAVLSDGQTVTGVPLGFIVETEPAVRVYHFGDSAVYGDMRLVGELYRPTVGLLGCTQPKPLLTRIPGPGSILTGEMNPREAALAAELLGVDIAVATHYTDPDDSDVLKFLSLVESQAGRTGIALKPGETLVVDGSSFRREE